MKKTNKSKG